MPDSRTVARGVSELPLIISADDHVLEPPNLWVDRLPKKFLAEGPRVEQFPVGTRSVDEEGRFVDTPGVDGPLVDYWRFEDTFWGLNRNIASAGFPPEHNDSTPTTFAEVRSGCYEPAARLADMDVNHVQASLCFPNYPRFAGQLFSEAKDRELGLACVQAYNDWMVDEWCAGSGSRLIPLCIVPLWDPHLAAAEVRRNAARGVRAVCFTELPQFLGLPSINGSHWDPFFAACDETGSVISMHIGSGTKTYSTGPDMPVALRPALLFVNSAASMSEYLCSDVLRRYQNIKLFYAEAQAGWIPYVLDRLDDVWVTHPVKRLGRDASELPSTLYAGRVYSCMFKDRIGPRLLDVIGEDQVMFESDYPHGDGTWPHTAERAEQLLGDLSPEVRNKVVRANAIELFGLPFDDGSHDRIN